MGKSSLLLVRKEACGCSPPAFCGKSEKLCSRVLFWTSRGQTYFPILNELSFLPLFIFWCPVSALGWEFIKQYSFLPEEEEDPVLLDQLIYMVPGLPLFPSLYQQLTAAL